MTSDAPRPVSGGEVHHHDPASYGDDLGADYDSLYPAEELETEETLNFLTALAERHPCRSLLELGIGTGRLAIELDRRGLLVAGIEASPRMLAMLRRKAPAANINVALGDFVSTRIEGSYGVVALVLNNVLDERGLAAQLDLFSNAARHLAPGGYFVIEAFVLTDAERSGSWTVAPRYVGSDHVELQMSRFEVETSRVERTLVHLRPEGPRFVTVQDHYSSPGELDVMAHVNGLSRVERYSSWARAPFTATSRRHITVYQRPT